MNHKNYCQFCMKEQIREVPKVPINREIKQNFFELTQIKINTVKFCEFICCNPCLREFESLVAYRNRLIRNQETLLELDRSFDEKVKPNENEEVEEELWELEEGEQEISEEQDDIFSKTEENETDAGELSASVECSYCQEPVLDTESNHVCPVMKIEALEEVVLIDEEGNPSSLDDSTSKTNKKYPKKRLENPITCPKCNRLFYYKAYFQFHYKDVHREDREEVCQFCGKVFKNMRRLNSHMLIHQTSKQKKFRCDVCGKQFNFSGDLTRHKRVHENIKPFKCHLCPKSFAQSYALKLHIDVHNKIRYMCDYCALQFSGKPTLKKHMMKCSNGIGGTRGGPKEPSDIKRERYKCFSPGCDRQFSSRKYLGVHVEKAHKLVFENWETTCLECQCVFETAGDYAVHVKTHSCTFVCELCKLRFKTAATLEAHKNKLHKTDEDRPFVCNETECGARFKRAEHLKGHVLYKHSDERKFECNLCDLKFRQKGEFNVHMRVHMNTRPFSCWQCDHVCKTSSNLRQHMSLVHKETCIYYCKVCHQTFRYNTDLTQHKKIHSSNSTTLYEVIELGEQEAKIEMIS